MKGSRRVNGNLAIAITGLLMMTSIMGPWAGTTAVERSARADEPVIFLDITNSSGLGWGSRSRVAWGDFDGDGWDDLLFRGSELWRNRRDGTFYDVTVSSGVSRSGSRGGVWGDYDNDGDLDIYQLHGTEGDDRLLRNGGDGTFTDVTDISGEVSDGGLPSEGAAWGDYDNDGYLDLYVANYEDPPNSSNGTYDVLYHNNGDGTFSNVTSEAGMFVEPMCGRGVAWGDYDDDGHQDIYVANYRLNRNFLWHNNGDGTFTDVAEALGVEGDLIMGYYGHSIGATWGDVDNDGDLDLFVANLAHPRFIVFSDVSKLYINTGPPDYNFQDRPIQTVGIAYEETHSDPSFMDHDNDGDLDLFITSVYDDRPTFLYRNDGDGTFTDITDEAGTVTDNGWGEAWGDLDNDGFPDLVVGSGNGSKFKLFENGGNHNNWLDIDLKGRTSNSRGVGARIELEANGTTMIREVSGGRGTTSQDHIGAHFGLGQFDGGVNVTVHWPSGILQREEGLDVNRKALFVEPDPVTDFHFRDVTYSNETVLEGDIVTLGLDIENKGTVPGSASVELSVSDVGVVGTYDVVQDLGPMENGSYVVEWDTSGMGGRRTVYMTIVDAVPKESDESDNGWDHDFIVNMLPIARIVSIEPPVAYQKRDVITFKGEASDDGVITKVQWSSDLDGVLSEEMSFTTEASNLSAGVHTVAFKARDELGAWSEEDERTLMVEPPIPNKPPTARIINVEPTDIKEGEQVELEGEGSDPDGQVVDQRWESSLDGVLSHDRKFKTTALSVGEHTISFFVIDDKGKESDPAQVEVLVRVANTPPKAIIEMIYPNPAEEGEDVRFQGRGVDAEGQVGTFVWTSSLDGIISYEYNFVTADLSVGSHMIGLKVKDEDGEWSQEVFEDLEVLPVNERPTVTIGSKERKGDDRIRLTGMADDPDGTVVMVEVRVGGSGTWSPAVSTSGNYEEWSFDIELKDLDVGAHRVFVRAFDGIDHSDEVDTGIEVLEDELGFDDVWRLFMDALTGKNVLCLLILVIIVVSLVGLAYMYARGPRLDPEMKETVRELEERMERERSSRGSQVRRRKKKRKKRKGRG